MSGGAPENTTSTTELPTWAQPYAQSLLGRGAALSEQPMPVYTGQRSADLNQYQTGANEMVMNRAMNGSPEMQAGSQNLTQTLNGGFMNNNPFLSQAVDNASRDLTRNFQAATQGTDATFARNGAFGGSAWAQAKGNDSHNLAQGLGDISTQMNYANYGDERGRQMQAMGLAPTFGNQAYTDAQQLQGIGANQYAFDQQKLDDQMAQWTEQANSPYRQQDVLANSIRAAVGGGGTTSSLVPGPNPYAQALGGGAALYGLLK